MKRWGKQNPLHLDEREMRTDLGSVNYIFIGSSCDLWAESVPREWISRILSQVCKYRKNDYLFQTKNPRRYFDFVDCYDFNMHFGITLETNRCYSPMGNTPVPEIRKRFFRDFFNWDRFVTIEPIMDFDPFIFIPMIKDIRPSSVNIGADSGRNALPEPPREKVLELIEELKTFTKVVCKPNLKRIIAP
jgi:protein gp37